MKTINILSVYTLLIGLIIILFPFISSVTKIDFLGGLGTEGSFFPAILLTSIWLTVSILKKEKIIIPRNKSFFFLCIFLLYLMASGMMHLEDMFSMQYQGVVGYERYFQQMGSMLFYFLTALCVCNVFLKSKVNYRYLFQWSIYFSFVVAGGYSLIEISAFFGSFAAQELLIHIDEMFRADTRIFYRLTSVSVEASFLGMYLGIVFPWFLSGVFQYSVKGRILCYLVFLYMLLMEFMTISRTGYVLFLLEIIAWTYLFRLEIIKCKLMVFCGVFFLVLFVIGGVYLLEGWELFSSIDIVGVITSLVKDDTVHDLSNIARYGSQVAAFRMFLDNPVFGVGFGMFGFHAVEYYPGWAWISNEIITWGTNNIGGPWPPVHGLYARIIGELGLLGAILWAGFLICIYKEAMACIRASQITEESIFYRNCLVSFLGACLCGGNVDAFRFVFIWVLYAVIWMNFINLHMHLDHRDFS